MNTLQRLLCISILAITTLKTFAQVAVGEWRDHLTYRNTLAVIEGNGIAYCATPSAIFSHDPASGELRRFTSVNALNDVEIRAISWNDSLDLLLVGYVNGNFDIIDGNKTTNLNDIKVSNIIGDKSIIEIVSKGTTAYLACGFGVVVIDLEKVEVVETWLVGPGGSQLKISDVAFYQDSIYLATDLGLYAAIETSPNLSAFSSWNKNFTIPYVPNGPFNQVEVFNNELLVNFQNSVSDSDTLYRTNNGSTWNQIAEGVGETNKKLRNANGFLVIPHGTNTDMIDGTYNAFNNVYGYDSDFSLPADAMRSVTSEFLIADGRFGLIRSGGGNTANRIFPNGPASTDARRMYSSGKTLYVASGGVEGNWSNRFDKNGVFHFQDETWGETNRDNSPLMNTGLNDYGQTVVDIMDVCIDPDDPNHAWATSWDEGLLEFRNRELIAIYNGSNSPLQIDAFFNDSSSTPPILNDFIKLAGIDYDDDGNLWMTNSASAEPIVVRTADGDWRSFDPGAVLNNNRLLGDILCGQNGLKWIIRPRTNGLLVFNDNGTLNNAADDEYKWLTTTEGEGGLPSLDVLSIAEDYDGEIWVGTNKGIAVFYDADAIFSGNDFDAQQILIEQDGNIQILLETEAISAIEADGAGRKWIGTESSGIFLVSRDGTEQIHHFTSANSPLPSNTITAIAVDGETGEVFIGTDYGILSYRGDATEGLFPSTCANVFPNPVNADYDGPITISGLTRESDIRITDAAGNLVYRTESNGGSATWPGVNMDGEKVASGVYIAFAVDSFGAGTCSTKILVVR